MKEPEKVTAALAELERQMDLFPRVFLDSHAFNVLFDAVDRCASRWDYKVVWSDHLRVTSYMLHLGHAEELRDQVRARIAVQVTEQLTGAKQ